MQECTKCQISRRFSEFNFRNKKLNIRQRECRFCMSQRNKKHYKANLNYYMSKASEYHKKIVEKNRLVICEYLSTRACKDCGEKDITVLEFDHRYGKDRAVSLMLRFSSKRLLTEIKKCDVRCANCHRRKTAKMFGYYRINYQPL